MRWHTMQEIWERGFKAVIADAVAEALDGADKLYVSRRHRRARPRLRAGHRHPGARRHHQRRPAAHGARNSRHEHHVVGVDVVEVSPAYDHADHTVNAAHRVVFEALGGMAWKRRPAGGDRRPARVADVPRSGSGDGQPARVTFMTAVSSSIGTSPLARQTTLPSASIITNAGKPSTPNAAAASIRVAVGHDRERELLPLEPVRRREVHRGSSVLVATAKISTPSGNLAGGFPLRQQWHLGLAVRAPVGEEDEQRRRARVGGGVISIPLNVAPSMVGTVSPIAASPSVCSNPGSASPVTVTSRISCSPDVSSVATMSSSPPPPARRRSRAARRRPTRRPHPR